MPAAAWRLKTLKMRPIRPAITSSCILAGLYGDDPQPLPVAGVVEAVIEAASAKDVKPSFDVPGPSDWHYEPYVRRSRLPAGAGSAAGYRDAITAVDPPVTRLGFQAVCSSPTSTARAMPAGTLPCMRVKRLARKASGGHPRAGRQRIGHGVKAVEDRAPDGFLAEQRIGIESCLTSNIQTSTVATLAHHPLKTFLNTACWPRAEHGRSGSTGRGYHPQVQHRRTAGGGLSREQIRQGRRSNGLESSFLTPEETRRQR